MFIRIYALAVCFASVLCIAISTGIGLYDVVQISFPKQTMNSHQYHSYQSNEMFIRSHPYPAMFNPMLRAQGIGTALAIQEPSQVRETEDEITSRRETQLAIAIDNTIHDALNSLIQILIILLVSIPLFIIHWRFAQKLDNQSL